MNKTIVTDTGCWEWQGAESYGYGVIMRNRERLRVHRVAYELWCEHIPKGMVIRHKCDNPCCVNPSHLETIDPVVLGRARAEQHLVGDQNGDKVVPFIIHGDAAYCNDRYLNLAFRFF